MANGKRGSGGRSQRNKKKTTGFKIQLPKVGASGRSKIQARRGAKPEEKKANAKTTQAVGSASGPAQGPKTKGESGAKKVVKKTPKTSVPFTTVEAKERSAAGKEISNKAKGGFNQIKTKKFNLGSAGSTSTNLVSEGRKARDAKKKVSGAQRRADKRKQKRFSKADKLRERASQYKAGDKKAARLEKRAKRQVQIGRGNRKTRLGSALKAVGKGAQAFGHAYAYGHTGRLKGNKVTSKKGGEGNKASKGFNKFKNFKKPSAVKLRPLGGKLKLLNRESDKK